MMTKTKVKHSSEFIEFQELSMLRGAYAIYVHSILLKNKTN